MSAEDIISISGKLSVWLKNGILSGRGTALQSA